MRVLLSKYGFGGHIEPMVGLAVQLGAPGAELHISAPPDCAAEKRHTPVASGVRPAGVRR